MSKEYINNLSQMLEHPKRITRMFEQVTNILKEVETTRLSLEYTVKDKKIWLKNQITTDEEYELQKNEYCNRSTAPTFVDGENDNCCKVQDSIKALDRCEKIIEDSSDELKRTLNKVSSLMENVQTVNHSFNEYMSKIQEIQGSTVDTSFETNTSSSTSYYSATNQNAGAKQRLFDYMCAHKYTKKDYNTYKYDCEWKELHRDAFPELYANDVKTSTSSVAKSNCWDYLNTPETIEQCLENINPNFSTKKGGWTQNCQRCVAAYELRRRGIDITAQPILSAFDDLAVFPFSVWNSPYIRSCSGDGKSEIETKMAEWGDGARVEITVFWKVGNDGHAFIAEQVNGKTVFLDPQKNNIDCSDYFNSVEIGQTQFARIDNLELNDKISRVAQRRNI